MPDTLDPQARSERMSRIRSKDSKPELVVRRLVHGMGFRYRLHRKDVPGKPDLVFGSRKKVIFVHGCFWHRHADSSCKLARLPKSRLDFWLPKLERNAVRDAENSARIEALGWDEMVVWECEVSKSNLPVLSDRIRKFLCDEVD
ncbi:DNA mismatch endonuclease Vsr [Rhizobium lentis]|uniref:very short patch repair endonuclease n=1 Tax=Rhizobium lentis TaxID=1138194 RepID=UPI001C832E1C|nr:DNA mismatch endonuclease Vsr [Rhizobium lentis]MBX5111983.1 DNA mismatch endonuclease Vsr [Rhizobium lentis]